MVENGTIGRDREEGRLARVRVKKTMKVKGKEILAIVVHFVKCRKRVQFMYKKSIEIFKGVAADLSFQDGCGKTFPYTSPPRTAPKQEIEHKRKV